MLIGNYYVNIMLGSHSVFERMLDLIGRSLQNAVSCQGSHVGLNGRAHYLRDAKLILRILGLEV